ncbi:beta-lactamase family protein [Pseudomonas sp. MTM4]|uniref:serine hydrolase domain-containing protein n=1 Tax=unclassified Pseudomonas TaxID=196821 RepID=UPI0018D211E2|nr:MULTISPECIES: serine hydrolase domain-containing protein [unclassified Pseudomonas]MBC8648021.1 beta-lactamase family protein [Pseudomonas sp. MT4]QXY93924.1 beta-lactamase family protein [Pseudomonas sp. MTM4]
MQVQGYFDLRFEAVKDAFSDLFEQTQQRGAAVCVKVGGETVVDLWAGVADNAGEQVWQSDTLVNLFSCTKTFTAVAALQLVGEGKLQLDEPIARVWPEFAANGKQAITLRQLLSHQAGLPAIRQSLPPEALYDWEAMIKALAAEAPWWTPGDGHGYAAITYGWLLGEVIRRADGREPGEAIVARTARPLELDFHLGLADAEFDRVGYLTRQKNNFGDAAAQRMLKALTGDPQSLTARAFTNPPSIMNSANKPEWRRMVQPAANGHGNARALAGFYDGLLRGELLDYELLTEMTREHCIGEDRTLLSRTRFGLGCWLDQPDVENATFGTGAGAFGHPGAGGCVGFADPQRDLAFGYVTNTLGPYVLMDPRAQTLARAVNACLA